MSDVVLREFADVTENTSTIFIPFIRAFGGVERLVGSIAQYQAKRGVESTILCFEDSIGFASHINAPITIRVIDAKRQFGAEILALRRAAAELPDSSTWLIFDLKGAFYASALARPFVLHLTDPPSLLGKDITKHAFSCRHLQSNGGERVRIGTRLRGELAHRLTRLGVRRARRVIVMTEVIAREIEARYDVSPIIIRPGVAIPPTRAQRARFGDGFRVLSVSRLEATKRIDHLLRAVAHLRSMNVAKPNMQLDIVGAGREGTALRELATSLALDDMVHFYGEVDDAALEERYRMADLFVMPAAQGYGLPALEALARQVPVVMHEDSGVSEILRGTPWVHLVRGASVEELANGILQAAREKPLSPSDRPHIPTDDEWAKQLTAFCCWS